jgi:Zn-dependent protease with chaperone function
VSRLTLLVILVVWMSWSKKAFGPGDPSDLSPRLALAIFFGVYAALVIALRSWATLAARRSSRGILGSIFRFQWALHLARFFIPVWLGVGVYLLKWGPAVEFLLHRFYTWPSADLHVESTQALLGTLPALLAWMGLWWAAFPVDQANREQTVLENLNDDLPVHSPPTFRQTFSANLRLQVMFTLAPVFGLLVLRDLAVGALGLAGVTNSNGIDYWVMAPATIAMFIFAPELLRRTLQTEKLPASPLRTRLEQMCRKVGLKYRDILLWRTGDTMGNAAVMGMIPRVRYVLLSDLLLETMTDEQIEAVFAHELGHVVHKHLLWFGAYAVLTMLFMYGPGDYLLDYVRTWYTHHWSKDRWEDIEGLIAATVSFGSFALAFGYLSPKFERQADVYAARTMEVQKPLPLAVGAQNTPVLAYAHASYVGEHGAALVASALNRVAAINHIPVSARNWSHGSIATRVRAILDMSGHPNHTRRFDRFMTLLYTGLVTLVIGFGIWAVLAPGPSNRPAGPAITPTRALAPTPAASVGR